MTRYIDADALEPLFYEHLDDNAMAGAMNAIADAPTIDAVEVVRCGECRLHGTYRCPMWDEDVWGGGNTKDYMWCYFGERRTE